MGIMKTFFYFFRGLFAISCLSSAFVLAQVDSGQIAGTVADQPGAVSAGATVTVKNVHGCRANRPNHRRWWLVGDSPKLITSTRNWLGKTGLPEPIQGELRCQ
jgi:hypothetical protein